MGPWNQLKRMFAETRIIATIIVLVCIIVAYLTLHSLFCFIRFSKAEFLKAKKVIFLAIIRYKYIQINA